MDTVDTQCDCLCRRCLLHDDCGGCLVDHEGITPRPADTITNAVAERPWLTVC